MNLYVIGPVTGKPNENRKEFERVRGELWENLRNLVVIIPHDFVMPDATWEQAMGTSIGTIMQWWGYGLRPFSGQKLGIAMLDGWEQSKGATIEHDLAEALGITLRRGTCVRE